MTKCVQNKNWSNSSFRAFVKMRPNCAALTRGQCETCVLSKDVTNSSKDMVCWFTFFLNVLARSDVFEVHLSTPLRPRDVMAELS